MIFKPSEIYLPEIFFLQHALANVCSELSHLHALDQLFSMCGPGTRILFAFFILILTQMHSGVFQRLLDMCYPTVSMQKQALESSILLLSQTMKGFSKMYTLPFFSLNLFLENILIFIKICYYQYAMHILLFLNEINTKFLMPVLLSSMININGYNFHK